ncbi:AMIN-like domain-containing (lipo)protein [Streptomyces phaeoluteigriseus]|uniref:AMIN-like domain-containing (lipo)protein n=1 Tax=Streptomyces phaeoluteigriseus TaxID=114686 RepID=UPI0036B599CE
MVRTRTIWATAALMTATLGVAAIPAQAAPAAATRAATACPTGWGSVAKTYSAGTMAPVRNARSGQHACHDRLVIDVPGAAAAELGYSVRYVDRLYQDGSGRYIPVAGGAILEVRVSAPAYDPETGTPTYPARIAQPLPGVDITGYRTFRDTRYAGSFEGETQIGLGVRARLPFRVQQLDGRLVIDVAHSWTATR